ncbi:MAG TPA: MAPEG family protein [Burkholderiaceae bacterium]|jgi:glutathione S-transferase
MALHLTGWITLAAMLMYIWVSANVGKARGKFQISAPVCEGPVEFQSVLRVQANTVEQVILFFPALWMCAYFYSDLWAAIGGAVWIVGRIIYALGYYQDPKKRSAGFGISSFATLALMAGTMLGLVLR